MKIFYRNDGAITVFLSLILIPILILAGISVDAVRVYGASAILADSVELTMNTALANYEQALKDSYGILAMSSDENELSNNLIKYFENTINSMGLEFDEEDSYTKSIIDDIKNMISSSENLEFNNLIDMETVDFLAKGVEGTQIYYPETLKRQIVEYMKYRGLISLGSNFMEKLNIFKEIPKQQKYIESKVEYESSLSDLDESCKKIYSAIVKYDKAKKKLNNYSIEDFYSDSISGNGGFFGLSDINKILITLYANKSLVENILDIDVIVKDMEYLDLYDYFNTGIAKKIIDDVGTLNDRDNADEIIKYYFDINKNSNEIARIMEYYILLTEKFEDYRDKLIIEFEIEEDERREEAIKNKTKYVPRRNTRLINAENRHSKLMKDLDIQMDTIISYCLDMKMRKSYISDLIENDLHKLNTYLHERYLLVKEMRDQADIASNELDIMLNDIIPELDLKNKDLEEKIKELSEGNIKNSFKMQHDDISKSLNKNEIKKLKDIMLNNKNFYDKYLINLDGTKYINKFFIREELNLKTSELSKSISFGNDDYKSSIAASDKMFEDSLFTPSTNNMKGLMTQDFSDSLFYKYLYKIYKSIENDGSSSVHTSDAKAKKENIFELVNSSIKSYKDAVNDKKTKNLIPSEGEIYEDLATTLLDSNVGETAEDIKDLSVKEDITSNKKIARNQSEIMKNGSNLIESLTDFSLNLLESGRDKLFIAEYITEMFSCHTTNSGDIAEKTLNGNDLNEVNNYIFGSEMEYILWGQKGNNTDKNNFYTAVSIFSLRFALNAAYAYTDAEIKLFTLSTAVALAGFTGFGVPIVQNILILTLAMAESAIDLSKLLKGENIVLFKSYSTWMLKPSGITKKTIEYSMKSITEITLDKLSSEIIAYAENESDEAMKNLEKAFDEYADSLLNDISTSISDLILVPIQTELALWLETKELTGAKLNSSIDDMYRILKAEILKEPESFMKNIKIIVLDLFVQDKLEDLKLKINSAFSSFGNEIDALKNTVEKYIENTVSELRDNAKKIIFENGYEDLKKEVKKEFKNLTDDVKQNANNIIDDFVSNLTIGEPSAIAPEFKANVSTNLTFNYKEYIKVFLLAGMIAGKENLYISRMCDLIKLNLVCSEAAPLKNFKLKNSYAMVKIDAEASVKTTFMRNKIFKNPWDENKCYLKYSSIYGY